MRRPPDKDGKVVTDRDVDSSNATLRTLVGGARQKSWMIGAGAPVRPTPRTSVSRPAIPQVTLVQKTPTSILPSPAPSDEPSPPLPSTIVNGVQAEGRQPQEDSLQVASTTVVPSVAVPQSHSRESESSPPLDASLLEPVSQILHITSAQADVNSPSTAPTPQTTSIPPLPSSVLLPVDRQLEEQSSPLPTHVLPRDYPSAQPRPAVLPTRSAHQAQQSPKEVRIREIQSRNPPQSQLPSPMQTNIPSPQLESNVPAATDQSGRSSSGQASAILPLDARTHPAPGPAPTYPRKRQRIQPAAMPSLKPRVQLIENHIQKSGGHNSLDPGLARPRFQLLADACTKEDAFYVALHQIFCCWDVDRDQILNIVGYPSRDDLHIAFGILGQLIRDNDGLASEHKTWFANFPSPLRDLLQSSEPYRRTVGEVGVFLNKLALEWQKLSTDCSTRGFPPLVDELVSRLGLLSPILQGVVFTASRRNLGIRDEEVGTQMEDLFRRDRQEHEALAARYNTAYPPTHREAMDRNQILADKYLKLHNHLRQQRQSARPPSGSHTRTPTLPSNDYPQSRASNQPSIPRPQHQSMNQGNWAQNAPNPSNTGSRPPSVGSHRMYANTPSPILIQGLSMQSPVQQNFPSPTARNDAQPQILSPQVALHPNGTYYQNPLQQVNTTVQQPGRVAAQNHLHQQQQQQNAQQFAAQQNHQRWLQHNLTHQPQQQQIQPQQVQIQQHQMHQQHLQIQRQQQMQHQQQQARQQQAQLAMQSGARQVSNQSTQAEARRGSHSLLSQQQQHQRGQSRNGSISSNGYRPQNTPVTPLPHDADIQKYNSKHVLQKSLVPPAGYVHPPHAQNPDVTALHQAHIRSPRLVAADGLPSMSQDDPSSRYYQIVRGFVLSPIRISSTSPLTRFDFTVPQHEVYSAAKDITHPSGQLATREFRPGTLQFRLRCVQTKKTESRMTMPDWVVADTIWPESTSISINKTHLEIRRKNHHGKDLPVDITPLIQASPPNSTNQISLSIIKGRTKMKDFSYFLAVEVIEILSHSQILEMCYSSHISASITLNKIKKSLTVASDDDDVAMVVSDLSIDLADPFTSKVFQTPVRGNSCLHRECFDLEVFLLTRNSKPKRPEQPCMVDVWKCPLCGKDARPYSLQIDDFLASIRVELEKQGKLDDVKAILIDASGNWRPKVEPRSGNGGNDSDYSSDGDGAFNRAASAVSKQSGPKKVIEVISLDD